MCERFGCPGANEKDCSGHGTCNSATHVCDCDPGYAGIGCQNFTCPGKVIDKVVKLDIGLSRVEFSSTLNG